MKFQGHKGDLHFIFNIELPKPNTSNLRAVLEESEYSLKVPQATEKSDTFVRLIDITNL